MSPFLVSSLSLVPGAGHWMLGRKGKAAALFVIDFGIVCAVFFLRSTAGRVLTGFAYLMAMVPAVMETYTLAHGRVSRFSNSKFYILAMLLAEGFTALPLLWQSSVFSKRIKIAWSIAVPVLAVIYFCFLGFFGARLLTGSKS